jgi:hypothetical protein
VRTSLAAADLDAPSTVRAYKDLSRVELAFRSLKTVDLKIRPIHHWLEGRMRAHVFLCMLADDVEWHMRQRLKPILFDDAEPDQAECASPVAPAQPSQSAKAEPIAANIVARPTPLQAKAFERLGIDLSRGTGIMTL